VKGKGGEWMREHERGEEGWEMDREN